MNQPITRPPRPKSTRTTMIGYLLSTLGLLSGGFGVTRLAAGFVGVPTAPATLLLSLLIGLVVSAAGFFLLVAGADSFSETQWPTIPDHSDESMWTDPKWEATSRDRSN